MDEDEIKAEWWCCSKIRGYQVIRVHPPDACIKYHDNTCSNNRDAAANCSEKRKQQCHDECVQVCGIDINLHAQKRDNRKPPVRQDKEAAHRNVLTLTRPLTATPGSQASVLLEPEHRLEFAKLPFLIFLLVWNLGPLCRPCAWGHEAELLPCTLQVFELLITCLGLASPRDSKGDAWGLREAGRVQ